MLELWPLKIDGSIYKILFDRKSEKSINVGPEMVNFNSMLKKYLN